MAKRLLGMDLGHDSIKIAQVNGDRVEKTAVASIPENYVQGNRIVSEESMAEFIKDTLKANNMHAGQVAYVLANENVYTRTVEMPVMTAEQLRINLPYEFSDFISDEPRKYIYDYAMLSEPNAIDESMELMGVAVQKEHLDSVRSFIKKAGLKLVKAAPTISSYISLIRENADHDREYCILDLGHKAIRMHMFNGERYEVTRMLDIGLSALDAVIAENLNIDLHLAHTYLMTNYENCQFADYCMSAYENITMELHRALNFYRFSNPDSKLESVWLEGGGIMIKPLREEIQNSLDLNVHHAKELLAPQMIEDGGSIFVKAIGITQE